MHAPRRGDRSYELTPEERSRGGYTRAAKIRAAKSSAMAEGRPYKPKRRRRKRNSWGIRDPYGQHWDTPGQVKKARRNLLRTSVNERQRA
jgi:hypothetical protein